MPCVVPSTDTAAALLLYSCVNKGNLSLQMQGNTKTLIYLKGKFKIERKHIYFLVCSSVT